jgi:predicted RNase H-like HicB family nuclease
VSAYAVVYESGPNDEGRITWSAYVPDLPGCVSTGETFEECQQMIREAIALHLEGMRENDLPIPAPTTTVDYVEVA